MAARLFHAKQSIRWALPRISSTLQFNRSMSVWYVCVCVCVCVIVRSVPPHFSIPPESVEVLPGGAANLTCVAVGSPVPVVRWRQGTITIDNDSVSSSSYLLVSRLMHIHVDWYACRHFPGSR